MLKNNPKFTFLCLSFLAALIFIYSLAEGASTVPVSTVFTILYHWIISADLSQFNSADIYVITELRLPRTLLAFLIGAALALTGAVLQTLFRNPLADPSLIGVSSGAALGAALMLVLGTTLFLNFSKASLSWSVYVSAFIGGIIATAAVMRFGQARHRMELGTLLLVGIAINALASSGIGLLIYLANETTLRSLTFWLLGSLAQANWTSVGITSVFVLAVMLILPFYAKALNALLLGEVEAKHLGIDVEKVKRNMLFGSAFAVGATVAIAGIIGFVGLVIPHIVRMLIGANHRYVLPAALLLGGSVLMLADIGARTWVAPAELPIGIITALLGAPFFLYLILREK